MLQRYLHPHAVALDEVNYIVRLRSDCDRSANHAFSDGDSFSAGWLADYWRELFRAKLSRSGVVVPRGARVLDCCCGLGYLGETLAADWGARVTCVDLSAAQLDGLKRRFRARGLAAPETRAADLMSLPFPDGAFDMVIGNSFLHHISDVPRALRELRRVLQSGGTLILLHEPSHTADFWGSFPLSLLKDTSAKGGFTDLWMFKPEDLKRLLSASGFSRVEVAVSGLLQSLCLNWLMIPAHKLGAASKPWGRPLYGLRIPLDVIERRVPRLFGRRGPSLMAVARKPESGA